jgi:hypothetical protein
MAFAALRWRSGPPGRERGWEAVGFGSVRKMKGKKKGAGGDAECGRSQENASRFFFFFFYKRKYHIIQASF